MSRLRGKCWGVLAAVLTVVCVFTWAPEARAADSLLVAQIPQGPGPIEILR